MTTTYNTLTQSIIDYANRSDIVFINNIPGFIYLAQNAMCTEIKNLGVEKYVVFNFIAGQATYQKPGRWRTPITMNYGSGDNFNTQTQMELRTYEYCIQRWPNITLVEAPLYYSDYGFSHFFVCPTPDLDYPAKMAYLEMPEPITMSNQTNWFTDYIPHILLYRCMWEAMIFLKNDNRLDFWKQSYLDAIKYLNSQDGARFYDRTSNRGSD